MVERAIFHRHEDDVIDTGRSRVGKYRTRKDGSVGRNLADNGVCRPRAAAPTSASLSADDIFWADAAFGQVGLQKFLYLDVGHRYCKSHAQSEADQREQG